MDDHGGRELRRRTAHRRAPGHSPTFVDRDPARAFLYQQLNTFHTPPMAAVGAALPGDAVAHNDLDATGVPVLVITSTDDDLFPPHLVIDTAQRLANASIVEVAGAGHSTYFERPDLYNDALIAFIKKASRERNGAGEQIEAFRTNGIGRVDDLLTDAELDTFEPLLTPAVGSARPATSARSRNARPTSSRSGSVRKLSGAISLEPMPGPRLQQYVERKSTRT